MGRGGITRKTASLPMLDVGEFHGKKKKKDKTRRRKVNHTWPRLSEKELHEKGVRIKDEIGDASPKKTNLRVAARREKGVC